MSIHDIIDNLNQKLVVKCQFAQELKHPQAEREFNQRLTQGQRYILRKLRIFFKSITDEEVKDQVNIHTRKSVSQFYESSNQL